MERAQEGAFGLPALVHDLGGRRYERLGWSDPTNRMLIHILPLVYYYLLQKYAPGIQKMARELNPASLARKGS